jgi:hypothetical protein
MVGAEGAAGDAARTGVFATLTGTLAGVAHCGVALAPEERAVLFAVGSGLLVALAQYVTAMLRARGELRRIEADRARLTLELKRHEVRQITGRHVALSADPPAAKPPVGIDPPAKPGDGD